MAVVRARLPADATRLHPGDSQPAATRRATTSAQTSSLSAGDRNNGALIKKRAIHRWPLDDEAGRHEPAERKESRPHVVAPLHDFSRDGRAHGGGAQRKEV